MSITRPTPRNFEAAIRRFLISIHRLDLCAGGVWQVARELARKVASKSQLVEGKLRWILLAPHAAELRRALHRREWAELRMLSAGLSLIDLSPRDAKGRCVELYEEARLVVRRLHRLPGSAFVLYDADADVDFEFPDQDAFTGWADSLFELGRRIELTVRAYGSQAIGDPLETGRPGLPRKPGSGPALPHAPNESKLPKPSKRVFTVLMSAWDICEALGVQDIRTARKVLGDACRPASESSRRYIIEITAVPEHLRTSLWGWRADVARSDTIAHDPANQHDSSPSCSQQQLDRGHEHSVTRARR